MRVVEKIQLIDNISSTLQQRYTYQDIDLFLSEFKVNPANEEISYDNKRSYVKDRLVGIDVKELKKIAGELDLSVDKITQDPPKNWESTTSVKAFISHLAKDKQIATRLRDSLKKHNIDCFVAHEDIKPSEEWQKEIEKALMNMDFFISIHTKGFHDSIWCQQEVGFAACRNVKVIPLKFDENPEGFIGKIQALNRGSKTAEVVSQDILEILKTDEKTKDIYRDKIAPKPAQIDEIPF